MPKDKHFQISQAAQQSGVSAKMIRHYEELGLIPKVRRSSSGYRLYSEEDLHFLKFIKQARELGFSTARIKALLGLWRNPSRSSRDVKALAKNHIGELETKIKDLEQMRATLLELVNSCRGDQRPQCPILNRLASRK